MGKCCNTKAGDCDESVLVRKWAHQHLIHELAAMQYLGYHDKQYQNSQ